MNILIVDDHPIVQKGLKLLLEAEKGWHVTGQAADGSSAMAFMGEQRPAVAIVDLNLPDSSGLEITASIKRLSPETRVIILSMHMNEYYLKAARRKGASAYVSKHVAEHEIVKAIKAVVSGGTYPEQFGPESADDPACGTEHHASGAAGVLTTREAQVLQMLASGAQNKDVAVRLNISVRTAEKHRANVMHKLGLKNHAELIHYSLRNDIIELPNGSLPDNK